jgi:hypothetical protein
MRIAVGQCHRRGVAGQVVSGHDRGDGRQRGQSQRHAGLHAGVEQAGSDAGVAGATWRIPVTVQPMKVSPVPIPPANMAGTITAQ